jgi:hypothetical protein
MGNYEADNLVLDFARRTKKNLEFIEEVVARSSTDSGHQVYEVTQLINSLLGLLVFPKERYYDDLPEIPLQDLVKDGWPEIRLLVGRFEPKNLKQLMRYLRNGIAHHNIEFTSQDGKTISGLIIWNIRNKRIDWKVELTLNDIRLIVYKFIELLEERIVNRQGIQPR